MAQKRVLVSWFSNTDILMVDESPDGPQLKDYAWGRTGKSTDYFEGRDHIETLLERRRFDEVHILSFWDERQTQKFKFSYEGPLTIHPVSLRNENCFQEVYDVANGFLGATVGKGDELTLYLAPGTNAMMMSFMMLGKTLFPATFLSRDWKTGEIAEEPIPFGIASSLGDHLRIPDANLQGFQSITQDIDVAFKNLGGKSQRILEVVDLACRVANRDVDVLILGESGTGKELFARSIHSASRRGKAGKPFVAKNCAAIPETLFESELFGSLPGAFSGAKKEKRPGDFERAHGGTLFLDEVGELSSSNQAKLLRALQPLTTEGPCIRNIQPVGMSKQTEEVKVDVRVIAATNRDLWALVREGTFREDLLYRFGAVKISLPPLRGRPADIEFIAKKVLDRINDNFQAYESGYRRKHLTPDAVVALCRRQWPGNIRELEGVLKQLSVFMDGEEITAEAISRYAPESSKASSGSTLLSREPGEKINLKQRMKDIQLMFVEKALQEAGNQEEAAALLGVSQQLVSKARKLVESGSRNGR